MQKDIKKEERMVNLAKMEKQAKSFFLKHLIPIPFILLKLK